MAFRRPSSGGSSKSKKFDYRPRTSEQVSKRATQTGYSKEGFVNGDYTTFTPADGDNRIRILPPATSEGYPPDGHFGMELWVHYGVGADRSSFLCLQKHDDKACPICDERMALYEAGEEDQARELLARKRVAMWIIDRKQEGKGPLLWCAPWTLDQEIGKQSLGEEGENLALDNPYEGYDVLFTREEGKSGIPQYKGVKIARKPSPIFDDEGELEEILEFVVDNPVPDAFVFADYDHIKKAFAGAEESPRKGKGKDADEEEEDERPTRRRSATGRRGKEKEKDTREVADSADLPSWDDVHAMSESEVGDFGDEMKVDYGDTEFDDLEAVQDFVCEQLGIEPPKKSRGKKDDEDEDEDEKPKSRRPSIGGSRRGAGSGSKPQLRRGRTPLSTRASKGNSHDDDDDDRPPAGKSGGSTAAWRERLRDLKQR